MALKYYKITLDVLRRLSVFWDMPEEDLMDLSYRQLGELLEKMQQKKAANEKKRKTENPAYARMVKECFYPWNYLSRFWAEDDILYAVSQNVFRPDLLNGKYWVSDAEFVRKMCKYLSRFAKSREEKERVLCDVHRVENKRQGLVQGKVILALLYQTYPELKEFEFQAYGLHHKGYEIYPNNNILTPFVPLMRQDVEAIKKRNISYCDSYHCGEYTPEKCRERLESEAVQHYFDVIRSLKPQAKDHRVF